ncbi:MAG TPA: hypothetical protein VFZ66_03930 [Herpetosiphonaceae bacterium]
MIGRMLRHLLIPLMLIASVLVAAPESTDAAARSFGMLYHDGTIVRTFAVSAPLPHGGSDPLFVVTNGVDEQLGITQFAPGDPGFSGGDWAVYLVTFTGTPYLLTSDEAVMAALQRGDVTVTRDPARDFRCPVQP